MSIISRLIIWATLLPALLACAPPPPPSAELPVGPSPTSLLGTAPDLSAPTPPMSTAQARPTAPPAITAPPTIGANSIVVRTAGPQRPFDRRLLGVNAPAWIRPELMGSQAFVERTAGLGRPLLRMPGGSWSNAYHWLDCEQRAQGCYWPWAARPSDFLQFARAAGSDSIWTVSISGTSKEAAALVAFFNGAVDDERVIGVDLRGRDWKTVGHWARLRAEQGSPEPLPVTHWEVGNEVYGGKQGTDCASWGWEDVWTCDGTEYVNGLGSGAERHEGYLEFRNAMRAVDKSILVGAVGVAAPGDWSNWGNEVIAAAGQNLDFYIVHWYAFSETPNMASALTMPQRVWPTMMRDLNAAFERHVGRPVPVAVTEYNLVAFQDYDSEQLMRRAGNALFIADTIGQLAEQGVSMAAVWTLANGIAPNGTDYGLLDMETTAPNPSYYGLALWGGFGDELLSIDTSFAPDTTLSAYAGRADDGTITLLVINKTDQPLNALVEIDGLASPLDGTLDQIRAESLSAFDINYNGAPERGGPSDRSPQTLTGIENRFTQSFPAYSISLLRLTPRR